MGVGKIYLVFIFLLILFPMASAIQPQQYNKILLDPLYRQSMDQDVSYEYTLEFNPADDVYVVGSAIVTFQLWMNPTVTFDILVDGYACTTPSYEVHTSYANAGEGTIFFDCSNIITEAGTYTVTLTPDDDTGAITGWVDLTYLPYPEATSQVFGTDYQVGDAGTSFIQLLDDNRQAINDASCYIDAFYPNKSFFWNDAHLTYQPGSDGVYYRDFIAPDTVGLYMLSSSCYIPASAWNDDFDDYTRISAYENITVVGGEAKLEDAPSQDYKWATTSPSCTQITGAPNGAFTNIISSCIGEDFDVSDVGAGESYEVVAVYVWRIPDNLNDLDLSWEEYCYDSDGCTTFTNLSVYNVNNTPFDYTAEGNYSEYSLGVLNKTQMENLRLQFRYLKAGGADSQMEIDAVGIKVLFPQVNKTDGWLYSEEISLIDSPKWQSFNATYNDNGQTINFWVTDSSNTTLCTGLGNIETCAGNTTPIKLYAQLNRTGSNLSPTLSAWEVSWLVNGTIREVKGAGELNIRNYVADLTAEINEVDDEVWNWDGTISNNILNQFATYIWNWTGSIATEIAEFFSDTIWTRTDRNLTYYEDTTNYSLTAQEVWNYSNRIVTDSQELWIGNTEYGEEEETGKVVVRVLDTQGDPVTEANCSLSVFYPNNTDYFRGLPMNEANQSVAGGIYFVDFNHSGEIGVHPYAVDCLKGAKDYFFLNTYHVFPNDHEGVASTVWNYNERNLTWYEDVTNYTRIDNTIYAINSSLSNQLNLTKFDIEEYLSNINLSLTTEINLVPLETWTYTTRNLTWYEDVTNYTRIDNPIYAINNSLSNQLDITQADIESYLASINLSLTTEINAVPLEVWNYTSRNLTFFPTQLDLTNYTRIADEVWLNEIRNLTWYEDVTNYSLINTGVWNYVDRNLTFFPTQLDLTNYSLINSGVWSYVDRNLTWFPTQLDLTNYGLINSGVWNYVNRNLTYTPPYPTPNNLTASDVWSYSTRDLTYYDTSNVTLDNISATAVANAVWAYDGNINDNILTNIGEKAQCLIERIINGVSDEWKIDISPC